MKKPEIKINFLMPEVQRTPKEHPFGRILNNSLWVLGIPDPRNGETQKVYRSLLVSLFTNQRTTLTRAEML